jgi:hypothetical protein
MARDDRREIGVSALVRAETRISERSGLAGTAVEARADARQR